MTVGPFGHSVISGTARGYVVLWDLRYELNVQTWQHYDNPPIASLTACHFTKLCGNHPGIGPLLFVSALQHNEVAAYDMNTNECRVRFRVNSSPNNATLSSQSSLFSKNSSPSIRSQTSLRGSSYNLVEKEQLLQESDIAKTFNRRMPMQFSTLIGIDNSVDSSKAIKQANEELTKLCTNFGTDHDAVTGCLISEGNFVVTAGHDRVIRYWDVNNEKRSKRICGPSHNNRISFLKRGSAHEELFEEFSEMRPSLHHVRQNQIPSITVIKTLSLI